VAPCGRARAREECVTNRPPSRGAVPPQSREWTAVLFPAKAALRAATRTRRHPSVLRHRRLSLGIDGGQIEVELAGIFWPKRGCLELDHDVAPHLQMVKEEINKEFIAADVQPVLAPDKRNAGARFKQEPRDVPRQRLLDVALLSVLRQVQKVENVWVFQRIPSKVGLGWRESFLKIGDGASSSGVCASLDLHREYAA